MFSHPLKSLLTLNSLVDFLNLSTRDLFVQRRVEGVTPVGASL
jgi:hypothetical protein